MTEPILAAYLLGVASGIAQRIADRVDAFKARTAYGRAGSGSRRSLGRLRAGCLPEDNPASDNTETVYLRNNDFTASGANVVSHTVNEVLAVLERARAR